MAVSNPLVSIIVITYNSAKFVSETLESSKAQTYRNIELIISDDSSTDNTIEICTKWLSENQGRFEHTAFVTSEINTGVTANCNRGLHEAKGEWIKFIAGDDILTADCIERFLEAVRDNVRIICSETKEFYDSYGAVTVESEQETNVSKAFIKLEEPGKQFIYFLKGFYIPGPGLFLERKKLIELGGFEESYSNGEIRPLLLKYTYNNIAVHYLSSVLVLHRRHPGAITAKTDKTIAPYLKEVYESINRYVKFSRHILLKLNASWHLFMMRLIISSGNTGRFSRFLNYLRLTLQPLRLHNFLVKARLISENLN